MVMWTKENLDEYERRRRRVSDAALADLSHLDAKKVSGQPKKRIRQSIKPLLNKLELEFEHYLEWVLNKHGARAQAITFKLANGVRYTPDFTWDLSEAYEVKGFMRDDASVKLKIAARLYPEISWFLVWKDKHKQWQQQRILP